MAAEDRLEPLRELLSSDTKDADRLAREARSRLIGALEGALREENMALAVILAGGWRLTPRGVSVERVREVLGTVVELAARQ